MLKKPGSRDLSLHTRELSTPINSTSYAERAKTEADPDLLTIYLASLPPIPPPEVTAEYGALNRKKNDELQRILIGSPYVARQALELLRPVQFVGGNADKTLEITRMQSFTSTPIFHKLCANIPTIEKILDRNRELYTQLTNAKLKVSPRQRVQILEQIERNKDKIHLLVRETMLRREELPRILNTLERLTRKIESAQNQLANERAKRSPNRRLVSLLKEKISINTSYLGEDINSALERVALARATEKEFHQHKKDLVNTALHLVVNIAKEYGKSGLAIEDLIQDGNTGLIRAAEKFDPEMGFRFTTYATFWIRQAIENAIVEKSRLIKIPAGLVPMTRMIAKIRNELSHKNNCEPTFDAIMEECLSRMQKDGKQLDRFQIQRTKTLITHASDRPLSLDDSGGSHENSLGGLVQDSSQPFEELIEAEHRKYINEKLTDALKVLTDRERQILRCRLGFDTPNGEPITLENLGKRFKITRERVRQIEIKAIEQIRASLKEEDFYPPIQ